MQLASSFVQLAAAGRIGATKYIFTVFFMGKNGDNHIQNFHLGRYFVGYTFGNHVLRLRLRVAVKLNFRPYIRRYTSPNENFEYSYPLNDIASTFMRRCFDVMCLLGNFEFEKHNKPQNNYFMIFKYGGKTVKV